MDYQISDFIISAAHYLKGNNDFNIENINNVLDDLLLCDITDHIDENSALLSYCFHSLYWLLQSFTDYNTTANKCIDILIKLCSKDNIRKSLTKNLFFVPLCNLLSDDLSKDDKYKLLKLIDQLSDDIKLMFLPENLHKTLDVLSTWVLNQNDLISAISLQLLGNMCYRNANIKSILSNTSHIKPLYRHCLNEMNNSIHAIKLLISTNEYPLAPGILKQLTYETIFELVHDGNVRALRDIIDIFFDIRSSVKDGFKSLNSESFDLEYKFINYLEDASRSTVTGAQLAAETMRFLRMLVYHNIPALFESSVAIRLAKVALIWCSIDSAALVYNMDCAQIESILLLLALIDNSNKIIGDGKSFFKVLVENWAVLEELVRSVMKSSANNEHVALHVVLVRLMRTSATKDHLRQHVVKIYETLDMAYLFNISASQQNSSKTIVNLKDVFFDSIDTYKPIEHRLVILYTIALLVDISHSTAKQMLTHAQIHNVFSQILLSKSDEEGSEAKETVFSIIQSGYLPLTDFSKTLFDMPVCDSKIEPIKQIHYPQVNTAISNSGILRERMDIVTSKMEEMLRSGKIDDYTKEIILYYSLRISEAETSETLAKENLSAQSKTLALLEQRIQRYNMERDNLSKLSLKREHTLSASKKEIIDLKGDLSMQVKKLKTQNDQCTLIQSKFNDGLQKIEEQREELRQSENEKQSMTRKHEEDISKYQYKIKKQEKEVARLEQAIETLNENSEKLRLTNDEVQNTLHQCQEELNKKTQSCVQRSKDLIEIQKEKELLSAKIQALQSNFVNIQKIFN